MRNNKPNRGKKSGKDFGNSDKRFSKKKPFKKYKPKKQESTSDMESKGMRLNRFIAQAGICSRREADVYIATGSVKVNGDVISEMGYRVKDSDEVRFDDRIIKSEKKAYVLLNKPKNFITTTRDDKGRRTVMELVEDSTNAKLLPVGRMHRNTTGLLLFTNDGDLSKKLTNPKNKIRKIYHVSLNKNVKLDDMKRMTEGISTEEGRLIVDEVSYIDNSPKSEVGVIVHSGRNSMVRLIFEQLGYDIIKLDRVVFAGLTKKNLPRGHWKHLSEHELNLLKMIG